MSRITQQQLESYLWGAATLLRGTIDAGDYKQFIFPLLFYKRLCDVFDEETLKALRDSGGDEAFAQFPENHRFQIPPEAHWREVRKATRDVGRALQQSVRAIETANQSKLYNIFGDAQWTNKDRLSDSMLRDLVEHFSTLELTVANLPEDELGQGYEFLIKKFADDSGHTAAEFYTNRTVVHLMTEMLDVQPGESVYDPTCGSGGMLLSCVAHLRKQGKEWRNVKLFGQERNLMTSSIARMNCFLHGIEDFRIERGDTLAEPKLVKGDRLMQFDAVLANPPYSIKQWDRDAFATDPWGRNLYGTPPQGRADYAFQQHILQSLKPTTGRCAVLWPHGVLFRQEEEEIRRKLIESDLIECVVGLGPNLFYNSAMDSCVVICRTDKSKVRRGKVLLIGAKNEVSRERNQSFLSPHQITRIVRAYEQFKCEDGFSSIATIEDIRSRAYNLNIALYISNVASRSSPAANPIDAPNVAFRTLLRSSARLYASTATILNLSAKPSVDSDRLRLSLPTWLDRSKWRKVKLGDVVRQIRDKVDGAGRADISHYLPGGGISATSFRIKEWKDVGDGLMGPAFHMRFKPHHVLYKSRVPHGVSVSDRIGICANTTYVLEAIAEGLDQRLLPFLLVTEGFRQFERDNNRGSTNLFLNYSDIAKFEFDLPPLEQQRRIADILWTVDEVATKQMRVASCIEALIGSTIAQEVHLPHDRYVAERFGSIVSDSLLGTCARGSLSSPTVQLIKMGNLTWGHLDLRNVESVSVSHLEDLNRLRLKSGDFLFNTRNTPELVGKSAVWEEGLPESVADNNILRCRFVSSVNPHFICYQMSTGDGKQRLNRLASGSTSVAAIYWSSLKRLPVYLPSRDIQDDICARLHALEAQLKGVRTAIDSVQHLRRELTNVWM